MTIIQQQLPVIWSYHAGAGALIWQFMFTGNGELIGQKRYPLSREALFFSIETESGKVFFDDYFLTDTRHPIAAGEGWFTGFETTSRNLLYCHLYQPQSPEHLGIWALDARSGRVVWSRRDIIFAANLEHEFLVYRLSVFAGFPERHFILIDPESGEDIRHLGSESMSVSEIRAQLVPEEERQQVVLPEFVSEGMALEHLALQRVGVAGSERCECIVQGTLTVAALHEAADHPGLWNSRLKVWQNDRLVYADWMESGVEKPGLNNFLIRGVHLYYIKNKAELLCVALS
ncbi:DUF4905 domain-containing protein [Chlorobium ferrooxidans]|uniref:DUF4905 domain-containing protein n=1 Tax=Chlorobium ferrooxidans DSM 13031 TaxID=377431 RepID=Q0YU34_9CHLB|nr:DUF4905 domain-containing protein [Chlorobium ferrooxidans]EAT59720.1 conserved hypothetical protein [Chlorobium ferrooxidans DSM 13031]